MLKSQKKIGFFILLGLFSVSVNAQTFDGFYFGGGIGGSQSAVDVKQNIEVNGILFNTISIFDIAKNNDVNSTDNSFLGGLNLGFGHVFSQRWYLGIEGDVLWQNLATDVVAPTQQPDGSISIIEKTKVDLSNQFSAALVPGIVFNTNTLLYAKVGAAWGNFDVKNSVSYSQVIQPTVTLSSSNRVSDSGYESGLLLGLGMEHYLSQNISIKLEYTHVNYGSIHDNDPITSAINNTDPNNVPITGSISDSAKVSASTNSVMFGLTYHLT